MFVIVVIVGNLGSLYLYILHVKVSYTCRSLTHVYAFANAFANAFTNTRDVCAQRGVARHVSDVRKYKVCWAQASLVFVKMIVKVFANVG